MTFSNKLYKQRRTVSGSGYGADKRAYMGCRNSVEYASRRVRILNSYPSVSEQRSTGTDEKSETGGHFTYMHFCRNGCRGGTRAAFRHLGSERNLGPEKT